ncbi:sensor histidine kinase [Paenisporosarcina antarctica]|uniref:histidine kinase n=1 Tax=Paenisporosarcina antarctica TaxID=417367 RepID=A0A4P6ZYR4_9BACL|nr:PAS domain-containing sensor histidine kinase [Paenisporosarcina antarctica]QBP41850.1 PAS domain S-box protein [Paenisporosarcina antarctica]
MNQFFRSKITKRYLIISLFVTFCALALLYFITIQVMNNSVREEMDYRNQTMAKTVGKNTNYIFSNMINDLRLISEYTLKIQNKEYVDLEEVEKIISRNPLILHSQIVDNQGNTLFTIPNVHVSGSEKIIEFIDRVSWSETFYLSNIFTLDNGKKVIAVTYPIIDSKKNVQGGVIAYVNLAVLSQHLNQVKIGDRGVNALIDRNGVLISHSDASYIGTSLADNPIGNYLNNSKSGIWEGLLFNEYMVFAYQPMQLGSYGVIVGEPLEQALASTADVQGLLLKGFLTVLILTLVFTIFATSRIVKPIRFLTKQTREYKEGKRSSFQKVNTGDELEDLSVIMDEMATELSNKEKRLFNILESIPYAVITTDKKGNIETFNKGAEQLTLFNHNEVIGKKITDLPIKKSKKEFLSWQTLQEGKKFNEVENDIFDKDGIKHVVRIYSALFYDDKKHNIGAILILRDVSEVKKLEGYLKQSERMASLGQLTAGIAHEIKNPLSIIIAASDAIELELKEDKLDTHLIQEMTNDIIETSDRMNNLLTDFLKMSKGENENNKTNVNLNVLINELLSLLRKKLDDQQISVQQNYAYQVIDVLAIENQLNQVFLNIIINSIQAMEDGGVLTITVKETNEDWMIEIRDTGKGIPESDINWIFNPFYTTKKEGTGLGLSIAYEIISHHNGTIEATSSIDEGTTICVRLPKLKGRVLDE